MFEDALTFFFTQANIIKQCLNAKFGALLLHGWKKYQLALSGGKIYLYSTKLIKGKIQLSKFQKVCFTSVRRKIYWEAP